MNSFGLKSILCPIDFSDLSALALRYASDFRKCSGGRLEVLYANAFLPPPQLTSTQRNHLAEAWKESKNSTQQYLDSFVAKVLPQAKEELECHVVDSSPVEAIVEAATSRAADLIVMGTHGQSGENRMLLGSVAERVLREAPCPVLTVRQKKESTAPTAEIKNILVPINFSVVSRMALVSAGRIAQCFHAFMHVLRVIEPAEDPRDEADEMARLRAWIPPDTRKMVELQESVVKGEGAEQIVLFANDEKIDLIVMGAQHRQFFDSTVVGTTSLRVVRHAPCPVFTMIRK
ncbi:MAG: universal stress protein [Acidobacteriia bacterium]|nr:universal stress protein [Terriglobia bacterium]